MTASCDVTVTISIPFYPSTASSFPTDPGTEPPTYITVGQNTVTVTLPDGSGTTNLNDPAAPPEPTSTCYHSTVTVTEESNLAIATVTVTYDVMVNAGQPSRRAKTAPVAAADVPYYQRRACVEGGIFTVTQKIAQPMVVTQTIWRTITQQNPISIVVEPPTTSTYVVTTEGSTFSTTETRPAVTTTSTQGWPTGAGTTITETKTNAEGSTVVNAFTGVIVSHDDSVITSVTLVPVTTTNILGQAITTVKPSMVTQTLPKVDNGVIIITTDQNGHIVVTTKEAEFSILSQEASLESTLIMAATTLTDPRGHTTLTTSVPVWATPFTTTRTDSAGSATTTETLLVLHEPQTTTFTGTNGEATSTATYYLVTSSTTLKGPNDVPTATSVTTQTMTLSLTTETNAAGIPTKTGTVLAIAAFPVGAVKTDSSPEPTGSPAPDTELQVFSITGAEYAIGLIIPTLLATLLTLPLRILDHVAKLYHPFHVLATTRSGASAGHSVCWETTGLWTFITRFQHFMSGELLLAATGTLVALGTILVPLSAETVRLILHGPECRPGTGTAKNCGITLGVFPSWSRVVVGILCVMAALLVFLMVWLWRMHRTGLNGKPWSLAAMAGLSENQDFQAVLSRLKHVEEKEGSVSNDDAKNLLSGFSYALESRQEGAMLKYSIVPVEDARHGPVQNLDNLGTQTPISSGGTSSSRSRKAMPFVVLTLWGRVVILLVLLGMLTLIITYWALGAKTPLGRWMRSETVGVRILVVTVGMIITLFWSSYFYCKSLSPPSRYTAKHGLTNLTHSSGVAFTTPYRILNTHPSRARDAVNMDISTNPLSGLARSLDFRSGTHDWYLATVAAVAVLSEFLPALLANVPYRVVQTSQTHAACVYLSASIIGLMIVVTFASFFVEWPHMPVDPSTLAGAMYYVSAARGGVASGMVVPGIAEAGSGRRESYLFDAEQHQHRHPQEQGELPGPTPMAYDPPRPAPQSSGPSMRYVDDPSALVQSSTQSREIITADAPLGVYATLFQPPPPSSPSPHQEQASHLPPPPHLQQTSQQPSQPQREVSQAASRYDPPPPQPASSLYHYEVSPP